MICRNMKYASWQEDRIPLNLILLRFLHNKCIQFWYSSYEHGVESAWKTKTKSALSCVEKVLYFQGVFPSLLPEVPFVFLAFGKLCWCTRNLIWKKKKKKKGELYYNENRMLRYRRIARRLLLVSSFRSNLFDSSFEKLSRCLEKWLSVSAR